MRTAGACAGIRFRGESAVSTLVHVSDIGWQSSAAIDGTVAGTVGKSKSIEALNISLVHQVKTGSVQVRAHVSQLGWQGWTSGTAGPPAAAFPWRPSRSASPGRWPSPTTSTTEFTPPT